ncbi:MAG: RDD family protein [Alphaproteobacteria bacterium]|nr:RDD family protein [Alphaproteobacteria bacterium]
MSGIAAIATGPLATRCLVQAAPDPQSRSADLQPARHTAAPAGFARRSAAAAIDAAVVLLFALLQSAVLVGWFRLSPGSAELPYFLIGAAFLFLYFAKAESGPHAATWGKRALKLAVRDRAGEPPGLGRATLRLAMRFVTVATLLIGWLTILFTPRRQALHDLLSGTVVVMAGPSHHAELQEENRR